MSHCQKATPLGEQLNTFCIPHLIPLSFEFSFMYSSKSISLIQRQKAPKAWGKVSQGQVNPNSQIAYKNRQVRPERKPTCDRLELGAACCGLRSHRVTVLHQEDLHSFTRPSIAYFS